MSSTSPSRVTLERANSSARSASSSGSKDSAASATSLGTPRWPRRLRDHLSALTLAVDADMHELLGECGVVEVPVAEELVHDRLDARHAAGRAARGRCVPRTRKATACGACAAAASRPARRCRRPHRRWTEHRRGAVSVCSSTVHVRCHWSPGSASGARDACAAATITWPPKREMTGASSSAGRSACRDSPPSSVK